MRRFLLAASLVFWTWTTGDGVLSFTNVQDRIPTAYENSAEAREWQDVREKCKCTIMDGTKQG